MTTDLRSTLTAADPARTDTYDDAALADMARQIVTAAGTGKPQRRRRLLIALPVAATLALGLAVAPSLLSDHSGASAEAATLLDRAADAIGGNDPAARPDQYWKVETTGTGLGQAMSSTGYAAALVRRTTTTYVAVDGSRPSYTVYGPEQIVRQLSGRTGDIMPEAPKAVRFDPPNSDTANWQAPTPAFLAALPRDPGDLEARLRADSAGGGPSADAEVFVFVADVLRTGLVPADLRQALYHVLADVPGVRVVDRAVSIGSGTGVALARDETTDGSLQEIVVDPATGDFVGERQVLVDGTSELPAGTVMDESTAQRTLVDAVPPEVVAAAG